MSHMMSNTERMMFDPRLLKYIEKKKYYLKKNMTPCISLETEFAITKNDIRKIKRYIQNKSSRPIDYPDETTDFPLYPPKIQYKNKLHFDKTENEGDYEKMSHQPDFEPVLDYAEDKTLLPVFLSRYLHKNKSARVYDDRNPNSCVQQIREQYHNNQALDPEIITDMMLGVPSHTKKSYGFNDSFEHAFDYIDEDVQTPNHVVLPFPRGGDSARLANKRVVARNTIN